MEKRYYIFIFLIMFILSCINTGFADNINIYLNNENINETLQPYKINGEVMVKADPLTEMFSLEKNWIGSINTLEIESEEIEIRMMLDSPFIQVNDRTVQSETGLKIENDQIYIPIAPVLRALGYLINYEVENDNYHIFKPTSFISRVSWREDKQDIILEMDELSPYRIKTTDNEKELVLELENTALSEDFIDDVSNNDFYLNVETLEKQAILRITIKSKFPIPFHRDGNILEEDNNLILTFMPAIDRIEWIDNQLHILVNDEIKEIEKFYLAEPRRFVIDIPSVMLSDFELKLEENPYIEDVRTSQFTNDPLILRIVLDIKEDVFLNILDTENKNKLVLEPTDTTIIKNLVYSDRTIKITTSRQIDSEIFTLTDPDRLVVDIINVEKKESVPGELTIEDDLLEKIRTSYFNDDRLRIVADLNQTTGYNWIVTEKEENIFEYLIYFTDKVNNINIVDGDMYTDIDISLTGKSTYEVVQQENNIIIFIEGLEQGITEDLIPQPAGIIKDITFDNYQENDLKKTEIRFELEDFYGYEKLSQIPDNKINISLATKEVIRDEYIIILDPGHGGFDPGAVGSSGLTEKEVVLDIAKRVREKIEDSVDKVIMTRETDEFLSLNERVKIANENEAALFVSIHANAATNRYSEGTETYIDPNKVTGSLSFAKAVHNQLVSEINRPDRGIKEANFFVTRYTEMPAILVEVAFLSNSHEETLLSSSVFRNRAADGIARGILKYVEGDNQ